MPRSIRADDVDHIWEQIRGLSTVPDGPDCPADPQGFAWECFPVPVRRDVSRRPDLRGAEIHQGRPWDPHFVHLRAPSQGTAAEASATGPRGPRPATAPGSAATCRHLATSDHRSAGGRSGPKSSTARRQSTATTTADSIPAERTFEETWRRNPWAHGRPTDEAARDTPSQAATKASPWIGPLAAAGR